MPSHALSPTSAAVMPPENRALVRFELPPVVRRVSSIPLFQLARRAITTIRVHPFFTPRVTFARWRAQRALRAAARAARDRNQLRDWQADFHLNGLTWHHMYISQDLRRIALFMGELHRAMDPVIVQPRSSPGAAGAAGAAAGPPQRVPHVVVPSPHVRLSPEDQGALLVRLERAYTFLLDNVCDVYNSLEKHVLFPWIANETTSNVALARALQLFSKERARIEDHADRLQARFARLVCATGYTHASTGPCTSPKTFSATRARRGKRRRETVDARARAGALKSGGEQGSADEVARRRRSSMIIRNGYTPPETPTPETPTPETPAPTESTMATTTTTQTTTALTRWRGVSLDEVAQVAAELKTMIEDTEELQRTERSLLYPIIAKTFSDREQLRVTHIMVYSMRSALAKFLITIYHQAVEKNATRAQWRWYKREVPLPIRVYTPVWRARLYDGSPLGWLRQTHVKDVGRGEIGAP